MRALFAEGERGFLVYCDYTYINDPISAWDYTEVIKQYSHVKYSPFNSNGTGNLGYLYELDQRLAAFFLEESIIHPAAGFSCAAQDSFHKLFP